MLWYFISDSLRLRKQVLERYGEDKVCAYPVIFRMKSTPLLSLTEASSNGAPPIPKYQSYKTLTPAPSFNPNPHPPFGMPTSFLP